MVYTLYLVENLFLTLLDNKATFMTNQGPYHIYVDKIALFVQ